MSAPVLSVVSVNETTISLRRPDGNVIPVPWRTLRAAASQDATDLRAIYAPALAEAARRLCAERDSRAEQRAAACRGHRSIRESEPRGYRGGVAVAPYTDENRRAHGNICVTETCACGAERSVLHNAGATEESPWRAPQADRAAIVHGDGYECSGGEVRS